MRPDSWKDAFLGVWCVGSGLYFARASLVAIYHLGWELVQNLAISALLFGVCGACAQLVFLGATLLTGYYRDRGKKLDKYYRIVSGLFLVLILVGLGGIFIPVFT
ncbi:hypothetical protein D3261_03110 [Halococcus sp. IIIV-5B]|nr:hypothetical protein D3261_03110 [Halococcus sp. IIIV-5B]